VIVSPGRTGRIHFSSRTPRAPALADSERWFAGARGLGEVVVDEHPHTHRGGVPAGGDEAAELRLRSGVLVGVKRLGVVLLREIDNLLSSDSFLAERLHVTGRHVLEVVHVSLPCSRGNLSVSRAAVLVASLLVVTLGSDGSPARFGWPQGSRAAMVLAR